MSTAKPSRPTSQPRRSPRRFCFLLSDDASFTTGAVMVPDGGETAV
jgi:hypothetical protein